MNVCWILKENNDILHYIFTFKFGLWLTLTYRDTDLVQTEISAPTFNMYIKD